MSHTCELQIICWTGGMKFSDLQYRVSMSHTCKLQISCWTGGMKFSNLQYKVSVSHAREVCSSATYSTGCHMHERYGVQRPTVQGVPCTKPDGSKTILKSRLWSLYLFDIFSWQSTFTYSETLNNEYIERIHQMSYSSLSDNGMLQIFRFLIKWLYGTL